LLSDVLLSQKYGAFLSQQAATAWSCSSTSRIPALVFGPFTTPATKLLSIRALRHRR
jgi:hypothetical protein